MRDAKRVFSLTMNNFFLSLCYQTENKFADKFMVLSFICTEALGSSSSTISSSSTLRSLSTKKKKKMVFSLLSLDHTYRYYKIESLIIVLILSEQRSKRVILKKSDQIYIIIQIFPLDITSMATPQRTLKMRVMRMLSNLRIMR